MTSPQRTRSGPEKRTFFDDLYALDEHSSDEEDNKFHFKLKSETKLSATDPSNRPKNSKARIPGKSAGVSSQTGELSSARSRTATASSSRRTPASTAAVSSGQPTSKEQQQLFSGLKFYYLPKKLAKNAVRKIIVEKGIKNGAECVAEWTPSATHVMVDRRCTYDDVLKELQLEAFPENVHLVKEEYQADCLAHSRMVDPTQKKYEVSGRTRPPLKQAPTLEQQPQLPHGNLLRQDQETAQCALPSAPDAAPQVVLAPLEQNRELSSMEHRPNLSRASDSLDDMILEAKRLPMLDIEASDASDNDSSQETPKKKRPKMEAAKRQTGPNFQCMSKNDSSTQELNPNKRTIEMLSEMEQYYDRTKDTWRSLSYRKAIGVLKKQEKKICFASEALQLPGIGPRLADKIEEIVQTDQLRRLEYAKVDPMDQVVKLFVGIYGVGFEKAKAWAAAGHRTLDDILSKEKLSDSQRIGVEHYEDFNTRMPCEEVQKHGQIIIDRAKDIDNKLQLQIMGSYRRGATTCGDIDIMVTKEDATSLELRPILDKLVQELFDSGFLKCGLATPRGTDDGSKWHGASQATEGGPWRRIDFLLVPWDERGAALLYFTGNDIFNRSLRLLASKKGYRLNQRGLYRDVMRGPARKRVTDGTLVEGASEERIFEILGVPYRIPEDRNC